MSHVARSVGPPSEGLLAEPSRRPAATRSAAELDPFDALYAARFHQVLRWVRALGGPASELDDLAQETFLVVRAKLPSFDGRNVDGWLYKIARNVVSDHRRRAWFRRAVTRAGDEFDELPGRGLAADSGVQRSEAALLLKRVLGRMSADQRAAFLLYEVEGCSGEEIAQIQQVSVNTVYTRIHHARQRLLRFVAREKSREAGR